MNQWIAIVLVLGLFAIGDVVSSATGARISSVFVTLIGFLALFMSGIFPADIMTISGLQGAAGHRRSVPGVPHGHQHQHPSAAQGVENSGAGDPVDGRGNGIGVCSDPAGWLGCCCGYHPDRKRRYRCHQPDGGCCSGQGRYHGCGPGYPGLWRTEVCGHYSRF